MGGGKFLSLAAMLLVLAAFASPLAAQDNEREGSGGCAVLHDSVERALARLGFRQENRGFRPNLTLGRVRGDRDLRRSGNW